MGLCERYSGRRESALEKGDGQGFLDPKQADDDRQRERPSAGVLVAIDYLKTAEDTNEPMVALDSVKHSLSVLEGVSGVGNLRLRLTFLQGSLKH